MNWTEPRSSTVKRPVLWTLAIFTVPVKRPVRPSCTIMMVPTFGVAFVISAPLLLFTLFAFYAILWRKSSRDKSGPEAEAAEPDCQCRSTELLTGADAVASTEHTGRPAHRLIAERAGNIATGAENGAGGEDESEDGGFHCDFLCIDRPADLSRRTPAVAASKFLLQLRAARLATNHSQKAGHRFMMMSACSLRTDCGVSSA